MVLPPPIPTPFLREKPLSLGSGPEFFTVSNPLLARQVGDQWSDDFASARSNYETAAKYAQATGTPIEEEPGLLSTVLSGLDRIVSAGSGFTTGLFGADLVANDDRAVADRTGPSLEAAFERAGRGLGGEHIGWGDTAALKYDEDDSGFEKFVKGAGAFTGDVLSDPLTYISFGTSIGRGAASQLAGGAVGRQVSRELSEKASKDLFEAAGRKGLGEAAERATREEIILEGKRRIVGELDNQTILGALATGRGKRAFDYDNLADYLGDDALAKAMNNELDTYDLVRLIPEEELDRVVKATDGDAIMEQLGDNVVGSLAEMGSTGQSLVEIGANVIGEGSYRLGGARRLRSELNRVFGDKGEDLFRQMHSDVRGGARLRVPGFRRGPEGDLGFGLFGTKPRAAIPLHPGQTGGGQIIDSAFGRATGLQSAANTIEGIRRWASSTRTAEALSKLGGRHGELAVKLLGNVFRDASQEADSPAAFSRLVTQRLADEARERARRLATQSYETMVRSVPEEWRADTDVHRAINRLATHPEDMAEIAAEEGIDDQVLKFAQELRLFYDRWGQELEDLGVIPPNRRSNYVPHLVKDEYLDTVREFRTQVGLRARGVNVGSGHGSVKNRLYDEFWSEPEKAEWLQEKGLDLFELEDPATFNQAIADFTNGRVTNVFEEDPFEVLNEYQRRMLGFASENQYRNLLHRLGIVFYDDDFDPVIGGWQRQGPEPTEGERFGGRQVFPDEPPPGLPGPERPPGLPGGPAPGIEAPWRGGPMVPPEDVRRTGLGLPPPTSAGVPDGTEVNVSRTIGPDMEPSPGLGELVTPPLTQREQMVGMPRGVNATRRLKDRLEAAKRRVRIEGQEAQLDEATRDKIHRAETVLDMLRQTKANIMDVAQGARTGVSYEDARRAVDQALEALGAPAVDSVEAIAPTSVKPRDIARSVVEEVGEGLYEEPRVALAADWIANTVSGGGTVPPEFRQRFLATLSNQGVDETEADALIDRIIGRVRGDQADVELDEVLPTGTDAPEPSDLPSGADELAETVEQVREEAEGVFTSPTTRSKLDDAELALRNGDEDALIDAKRRLLDFQPGPVVNGYIDRMRAALAREADQTDVVDDLLDVTPKPKPEPARATTDAPKLAEPTEPSVNQTFEDADLADFEVEGEGMASPSRWRKRRLSGQQMFRPRMERSGRSTKRYDVPLEHEGAGGIPAGRWYTNHSSIVRVPDIEEAPGAAQTRRLKSWHKHLDDLQEKNGAVAADLNPAKLVPDESEWGELVEPQVLRSKDGQLHVVMESPDRTVTTTLDGEDWRIVEEIAETLSGDDLDAALARLKVYANSGYANGAVVTFDDEVIGYLMRVPDPPPRIAGGADIDPEAVAQAQAQEAVSLIEYAEREMMEEVDTALSRAHAAMRQTEPGRPGPTGPPEFQGVTKEEFLEARARRLREGPDIVPFDYTGERVPPGGRGPRGGEPRAEADPDKLPVPSPEQEYVYDGVLEGTFDYEGRAQQDPAWEYTDQAREARQAIEDAIIIASESPTGVTPSGRFADPLGGPQRRAPKPESWQGMRNRTRWEQIAHEAGFDPQNATVGTGRDARPAPALRDSVIWHGVLMDDFTRDALKMFGNEGRWQEIMSQVFEPYMRWFRTQATVGRGPGFVVRNVLGGLANARLVGATARDMLDGMRVARMWSKANREVAEEGLFGTALQARRLELFADKVRESFSEEAAEQILEAHHRFWQMGLADIRQMSLSELTDFTGRSRLFDQTAKEDLNPLQRVMETTAEGIPGITRPLTRRTADWTKEAEHALRFGSFMAGARRYGLEDGGYAASMLTKASQFDYGDLSSFERNVMREIIPFYTFTRKNLPLQMRGIVTDPAKFAHLQRLVEQVQEAYAPEEGSQADAYNDVLPTWFVERMGQVTGVPLGGGQLGIRAESPKLALEEWLPGSVRGAVQAPRRIKETAIGQANPLVDVAFGWATDRDPFTGQEIGSGDGASSKGDWYGRQISPLYANVRRLAPGQGTSRDESRRMGAWMSTVLGVPVATIDEAAAKGALRARAADLFDEVGEGLEDLAEQLEIPEEDLRKMLREQGVEGTEAMLGVPSGTLGGG